VRKNGISLHKWSVGTAHLRGNTGCAHDNWGPNQATFTTLWIGAPAWERTTNQSQGVEFGVNNRNCAHTRSKWIWEKPQTWNL